PDFRVTIRRDGVVRLANWMPWLTTNGPVYTMLHARGRAGVTIADLSVIHGEDGEAEEVIVDVLCEGLAWHREALLEWASFTGYRRIWLDG
ncbi:hypothetical protein ABTM58_19810, partial [Acinetobacter baumannii]